RHHHHEPHGLRLRRHHSQCAIGFRYTQRHRRLESEEPGEAVGDEGEAKQMGVVFWLSFSLVFYVYFGYPAMLVIWRRMAAERVGAASGELLLLDESRAETATDVGLYWRYEKALRSLESDIHSVAGATGAIYAIRRELYRDLPEETLLDDVLTPLRIVLGGKR